MKEKFQKFFLKLKTPKTWFAIVYTIIATLIIAATITLVCVNLVNNIVTYIFFGLSAIALSYLVYLAIYYTPKLKDAIIKSMKKHKFTNEMLSSYGYRSTIFAFCSLIINIAYAVFQGVFAILSHSIWFGALATYYIAISLIRGGIIFISRKRQKNKSEFTLEKQIKSYRNCGIYLVLLNFALIGALVQLVLTDNGFKYAGLMIYVMATYAFYKLTMSVYNLFKAKKHNDYTIQSIRNISFADSLVSILALQTALLYEFAPNANADIPNALTGGAVSIAIITIGLYMAINGTKQLKNIQKEKENGQQI